MIFIFFIEPIHFQCEVQSIKSSHGSLRPKAKCHFIQGMQEKLTWYKFWKELKKKKMKILGFSVCIIDSQQTEPIRSRSSWIPWLLVLVPLAFILDRRTRFLWRCVFYLFNTRLAPSRRFFSLSFSAFLFLSLVCVGFWHKSSSRFILSRYPDSEQGFQQV